MPCIDGAVSTGYAVLVGVPGVIQPDGIHPTPKGSEIIAKTLLPVLTPLLHK